MAPRQGRALPKITTLSEAQRQLDFAPAWAFTEGAGVTVAVIDTGVNPHPQLAGRLIGVADDVDRSDHGLVDCDGHGTLVAGLIAASPDPVTGFAGVAPKATILSIRQSSERYEIRARGDAQPRPVGDVNTLATAVRLAVDKGAQVINISEASCAPGGSDPADDRLQAAVRYAYRHNVVVVAAAGNTSGSGTDAGDACRQNTAGSTPVTLPSPARFSRYVLTVAAVTATGEPADFSLHGPWVDVAAPGTGIISLDPAPGGTGLVNQVSGPSGTGPIEGTSFAAPYVSGVVALVRARYPQLTAGQVIDRIERTAIHPAAPGGRTDAVGYGMIDPLAAVTAVLSSGLPTRHRTLPAAVLAPPPDRSAAHATLAWTGLVLGVGALTALLVAALRRRARRG